MTGDALARAHFRCGVFDSLRATIDDALRKLSPRSGMARALRYGVKLWAAPTRFLTDDRLETATANGVEPQACFPGFEHFLDAMSDPAHPQHQQLRKRCGGLFEPDHIDELATKRAVAAVAIRRDAGKAAHEKSRTRN